MGVVPVQAKTEEILIHADRRLVFQVLTAFGTAGGNGEATRVLAQEPDRTLVEFHTPIKNLLGHTKTYRTVEWVIPHEPERIDFEAVECPLPHLKDRFTLEARDGCTLMRYESEFGSRGGRLGWLWARFAIRPVMHRHMRRHLQKLRETIEARARRSKVFPQQPCEPPVD